MSKRTFWDGFVVGLALGTLTMVAVVVLVALR